MSTMMSGGCACGAIRYECDAEPMFMWVCHCRDCQRSTGGGGAVNVVFPKLAVRFIKGEPKYSARVGTSGKNTYRGFCPECGSPVAAKADLIPDIQGLSAAGFDDPSGFKLVAHIWTASAQLWDYQSPDLSKFETTPTAEELSELMKLARVL